MTTPFLNYACNVLAIVILVIIAAVVVRADELIKWAME